MLMKFIIVAAISTAALARCECDSDGCQGSKMPGWCYVKDHHECSTTKRWFWKHYTYEVCQNPTPKATLYHTEEVCPEYGHCKDFLDVLFSQNGTVGVESDPIVMKKVMVETYGEDFFKDVLPENADVNKLRDLISSAITKNISWNPLKDFYLETTKNSAYCPSICGFLGDGTHGSAFKKYASSEVGINKIKYVVHRIYALEAYTQTFFRSQETSAAFFDWDMKRETIRLQDVFTALKQASVNFIVEDHVKEFSRYEEKPPNWWGKLRYNIMEAVMLPQMENNHRYGSMVGTVLAETPSTLEDANIKDMHFDLKANVPLGMLQNLTTGFTPSDKKLYGRAYFKKDSEFNKYPWHKSFAQAMRAYVVWNLDIPFIATKRWEVLLPKLLIPSIFGLEYNSDVTNWGHWMKVRAVTLWKAIRDGVANYDDFEGTELPKEYCTLDGEPVIFKKLWESEAVKELKDSIPAFGNKYRTKWGPYVEGKSKYGSQHITMWAKYLHYTGASKWDLLKQMSKAGLGLLKDKLSDLIR